MNDEQQQMQDWYKQWKQAQITKDDDAGWRMEQRRFWSELLDLNRQGLRIAQEMQKQVKEVKEAKKTTASRQPAPPATLYDLGAAGYWKSDNDAAWNPSAVQGSPSADRPAPSCAAPDDTTAATDKAAATAASSSPSAKDANDADDSVKISRPVLQSAINSIEAALEVGHRDTHIWNRAESQCRLLREQLNLTYLST